MRKGGEPTSLCAFGVTVQPDRWPVSRYQEKVEFAQDDVERKQSELDHLRKSYLDKRRMDLKLQQQGQIEAA